MQISVSYVTGFIENKYYRHISRNCVKIKNNLFTHLGQQCSMIDVLA